MVHEFLANFGFATLNTTVEEAMQVIQEDFSKCVRHIETALRRYLMLKETDMLYKDYGVEAIYPYPKNGIPFDVV